MHVQVPKSSAVEQVAHTLDLLWLDAFEYADIKITKEVILDNLFTKRWEI